MTSVLVLVVEHEGNLVSSCIIDSMLQTAWHAFLDCIVRLERNVCVSGVGNRYELVRTGLELCLVSLAFFIGEGLLGCRTCNHSEAYDRSRRLGEGKELTDIRDFKSPCAGACGSHLELVVVHVPL